MFFFMWLINTNLSFALKTIFSKSTQLAVSEFVHSSSVKITLKINSKILLIVDKTQFVKFYNNAQL